MKGVPHFKKDGTPYKGPTHKDAKGKLMTGKTHTTSSKTLYHLADLVSGAKKKALSKKR